MTLLEKNQVWNNCQNGKTSFRKAEVTKKTYDFVENTLKYAYNKFLKSNICIGGKMNFSRIKKSVPAFLMLAVIITLVNPLYPRVVSNYLGSAYENQGEHRESIGPIETRVIKGAAYFLESYSNYLSFLNRLELCDLQPQEPGQLETLLESAISGMESTLKEYEQLLDISGQTRYNQRAVALLKTFDFRAFMAHNDLIPDIFKDVEAYLKNGDINGISKALANDFSRILDDLVVLRTEIDSSHLPSPGALLKLQGSYSRAFLFGQYTAAVLFEIKENM